MPRERDPNLVKDEVEAPKEPHLALMAYGEGGEPTWMPLPKGTIMGIIVDPKDAVKGMFPVTPTHIGPKRLVFRCPCGQVACDRKVTFTGIWTGIHPKGTDQISIQKPR